MSLTREEEKKLIAQAKQGDSEAMTVIYKEFEQEILRAAYGIAKNPDDAQDIASESFILFFKTIDRFDPIYPIRPWLHRLMHNQASSYFRKKNRYISGTEYFTNYSGDCDFRVEEELCDQEDIQVLKAAMKNLPRKDGRLLEMFYLENFSIQDLSIALTIPEGTVKSRLFNIRKKLTTIIEEMKKGGKHEIM